MLGARTFRLYRNRDLIGVELCGALKNIIAIAAGAAEQLGFGDNGKAGLITRGLAEMTRLGVAAGANPLTFAGLAGIGDVIATCYSPLSRNHRLGVELAAGRRGPTSRARCRAWRRVPTRSTRRSALAARQGVEMPIAQEVHNALFEGKSVQRCSSTCSRASRRTSWLVSKAGRGRIRGLTRCLRHRSLDTRRASASCAFSPPNHTPPPRVVDRSNGDWSRYP